MFFPYMVFKLYKYTNSYEMTSASLQNGVRVRIFLIVLLSIGVRIAREFSSTPVHKATDLLTINYFLYGLVLLCTVAMSKVAFALALVVQIFIGGIDAVAFTLSLVSTVRCISAQQAACIHTLPGSIVAISLVGIIWFLDLLQAWSAYKIIQLPAYTSFLGRRLRILFSWALPFAILNNIALIIEDKWTIWVTPHLIGDTLIIIMATSLESALLAIVIVVLVGTDFLAYMTVYSIPDSTLISATKMSIIAQISLSIFSFFMIFASKVSSSEESESLEESESSITKAVLAPKINSENLRKRKSTSVLAF